MKETPSAADHRDKMKKVNCTACCRQYTYFILGIVVIAAAILPRFIHLDADPQPGFIPLDVGYQIDEGYKTFAPKNLLAFGKTIWSAEDEYSGWMESSPATQWPYYFAFSQLGLELENARAVTVLYFAIFLAITLYLLGRRYGSLLALTAVVLLATDAALFYFSRSALFEIAMIMLVYTGVLLTTLIPNNKPLHAAALMAGVALITMYTVKSSAMLYFAPPVFACALLIMLDPERSRKRKNLYFGGLALVTVALIFLTRNTWLEHISLETLVNLPESFLLNSMTDLTPLALLLGYSCILHLLLVKPESLFNSIYRLSLTAMVIGTPLILSLFDKNPPRYYVAVVPACLLLSVEWLYLKPWRERLCASFSLVHKLAIAVIFIPFSMFLLRAINILILMNIPFSVGEDPGIYIMTLYKLSPFFMLALFIVYFFARNLSVKALGVVIPVLGLANIATGVAAQTAALMHPSYDSQVVRKELSSLIVDPESVAGDWAAFFTAETPIRSFYMSEGINFPTPEHIDKIRPNYFLYSGTVFDKRSLRSLEANRDIELSEPELLGTYMEQDIIIYPVNYLSPITSR